MTSSWDILAGDSVEVAPLLLGSYLIRDLNERSLVGKIVETEAYDQMDAASHSYRGRTPRTEVMFGPPGHLYVYFTYGMHYCCNVVTGPVGHGSAVLIRAIEPVEGVEAMKLLRRGAKERGLTNGPGKLCQALAIDKTLNGHNLRESPLRLAIQLPIPSGQIVQTARVGVSQAKDVPWRFYVRDSGFISRK